MGSTPYSVGSVSQQDYQKILDQLQCALAESNQVSDSALDKLHPELKVHYRREFQPGLKALMEGFKEGDFQKQLSGQVSLDHWIDWANPHVDAINQAIDTVPSRYRK